MLHQKLTRLAADFAAQIIGVLTAAPLDELVDLASGTNARPQPVNRPAPVSRPAPVKRPPPTIRTSTTKKRAPATRTPPASPLLPGPEVTAAALAFFAERGSRGATAQQVGERLAELGLPAPADVVAVLAQSGGIRDAGFRRAAGKNATAPVYVAT